MTQYKDPSGSVDDVLITAELASRPSRNPGYEAESRALGRLAQEMATNPGGVLQTCAELVMELCQADSAGISILEPGGTSGMLRWRAAAGGFAPNLHGTMPREASPCGTVMERNRVLLFHEAERFFPDLRGVEPRIYENLLAPWHVNGEAVGTLWAIKHSPEGKFDAEDARLLQSLARFAAAAFQMTSALDEAKESQEELQRRIEKGIQAEAALRASESRARLLLSELQHRVRNTLAVIRSIARRTAVTNETVEDYAMHLDGRIDAFARVQAAVTRDPTAGLDLELLVAEGLLAFGAQEGERVAGITGPEVRLKPKAAETIALVIHELATNAVKYGALSTDQGRITVGWSIDRMEDEPRLVVRWIETGVRLSGETPRRRGFGTELIERTLAYELNGKASLEFTPDGLHCIISLPVGEILAEQVLPR
ncbi:sensor histidine kinase [Microvirga sesbaniae]|uniref:sensor histidine kinase n=1 Tax=Microvirga sesbaniae TaxID=681392 RepID=UPI0021C8E5ED|nr:HWE histidine kinase domain-containing protein [Microvirga sp. HBU67692]